MNENVMQLPPDLSNFVRDALSNGHSKDDIATSLARSNWTSQEIDQALGAWSVDEKIGTIPQPMRSSAAWDALFYALLFSAFGMVIGNILTLIFGQITLWLPEAGDTYSSNGLRNLRWSMAALIIFTPAFLWLHHRDMRASLANSANKFGAPRRWLSAIAIFAAAIALLCDGIYLIYRFLDGDLTVRFLCKSGAVALVAFVVIQYFRQDRLEGKDLEQTSRGDRFLANWLSPSLALLVLGLSFWTIGGPAQGRMEHHDRLRISDARSLARDVADCLTNADKDVPDSLDPMTCAHNPHRLSGYASSVTYERLSQKRFQLCTNVEVPERAWTYGGDLKGNRYCIDRTIK